MKKAASETPAPGFDALFDHDVDRFQGVGGIFGINMKPKRPTARRECEG